ncbi:MAG: serine/threonine protein kinase [Deltaproteobacteria bacterium]|jgi:serine/threonine-protein kinase|nr:serine/threonine protein kinase [Deltaproteobacteria bacterium]MBW2532850.1 serine/threonine protein kinase [Deltaproteobacteria bacterium]
MDGEAARLRGLLAGELDSKQQDELETRLAEKPALRRQLADMALEAERTQIAPAVRIIAGPPPAAADGGVDVDVGPLLGRGGMAIVRLGRQLKLDRSVAIKTLREEHRTAPDVARLLREARITGRLEHPNIVPVHDIVSGDDGSPQVVLKLIEGHTWSELMDDADRVRELFGAEDLLEWNLSVLMAVSRALAFAHSRGVLHRDVKPKNVMVGPFGEVYLVDWGIALELGDPSQDVEGAQLSGTGGYMAPEQLGGAADKLGPWTDTYLLGATLYHLLTGRPPHAGTPVHQRVAGAEQPKIVPLPDDIPLELRRIVERALEADPTKRTASPEDFRLSIVAFLEHRGALRLVERGHRERARAAEAHERDDEAEWEQASLAAELSYRAALEEWSECDEAVGGARRLAVLRIEHALARGEPHVAARVVEANEGLPDKLCQRVAAAQKRARAEEKRLERLVTDADRGFGHRARGLIGAGVGVFWISFWSYHAFYPPDDVTVLVAFPAAVFVVGLAAILLRFRQLLQNRINRTSMWVAVTGLALNILWTIGAHMLGLDMQMLFIGLLLVWAMFTSGMASLVDPWGTVSFVGFSTAFVVACYEPAWTPWAVLVGNVVIIVNQLVLNWARARRGFEKLPQVGARAKSTR